MIFGDNSPYTNIHNFASFGGLRKLINHVVSLWMDILSLKVLIRSTIKSFQTVISGTSTVRSNNVELIFASHCDQNPTRS